jgi:hypothetical protein
MITNNYKNNGLGDSRDYQIRVFLRNGDQKSEGKRKIMSF